MLNKLSLRGAKRRSNLRGFSLIELMVAVAILAMAIFGIFLAYSTGFMGMADARDRTVAVNYAREIMEKIRNDNSLLITGIETYDEDKYSIKVIITSDPTDVSLNRVTTKVSWPNRNGDTKEVELEMLVYNPEITSSTPDPDVISIVLNASPSELPVCCETSVIKAEVYDDNGLVDYSVLVSFSTTMGSLSADDAFTSGGIATVILTLDNPDPDPDNPTNSTATVTAIVGLLSNTVTVTCTRPVITVDASQKIIFTGETSVITATLKDADDILLNGKTVKFTITSGEGILDEGTTTAYSVTGEGENANGEATVVLSKTAEGDIIIEASYCNVSDTVTLPTLIIEVSASHYHVEAGGTSTITAKLTDSLGNPIEGEIINFIAVYDPMENPWTFEVIDGVTDVDGVATAELSNAKLGTATVTAAYGTLEDKVEDTVTVICTTFTEFNIVITAAEDTVGPDEPCTITATLTGLTGDGGIPVEGATITFNTTCGTLYEWGSTTEKTTTAITNEDGEAQVDLIFSVEDDGETATITGTFDLVIGITTVTCLNITITPINIRYWSGGWWWTDESTIEVDILVEGGTIELQEIQVSWVANNGEIFQRMSILNGLWTTVYDNGNAPSGEIVDIGDYTLNIGEHDIRFWWNQDMIDKSFTVIFNPNGENISINFDSPD